MKYWGDHYFHYDGVNAELSGGSKVQKYSLQVTMFYFFSAIGEDPCKAAGGKWPATRSCWFSSVGKSGAPFLQQHLTTLPRLNSTRAPRPRVQEEKNSLSTSRKQLGPVYTSPTDPWMSQTSRTSQRRRKLGMAAG